MRNLQIGVFVLGLLAFFVAALTAGSMAGQIFWNVGVAVMIADLALMKLWPQRPDWTRPGHCVFCGYDLSGDTTGRCPECGKQVVWRGSICS